jgi:hypothetical protein
MIDKLTYICATAYVLLVAAVLHCIAHHAETQLQYRHAELLSSSSGCCLCAVQNL